MKLNVPSGPERRRETWEERESLTVDKNIISDEYHGQESTLITHSSPLSPLPCHHRVISLKEKSTETLNNRESLVLLCLQHQPLVATKTGGGDGQGTKTDPQHCLLSV